MKAQRPLLAKRYAVHLPLDLGDAGPRFVGTDVTTGQTVIVAFAGVELAQLAHPAIGALQRHLAGILDVISSPSLEAFPNSGEQLPTGAVMVAESVRGRRLTDLLRHEPLNHDRAVAWTTRMLEGIQAMHRRQLPHGALSSHAIVCEPKGRPIAPVVTQLLAPALKDYASPERLNGTGPSIDDDLWAIGLLLVEMLLGKLPFHAQSSTWGSCELAETDTRRLRALPHGRELDGIVRRVLSTDRRRRPRSADEFIGWLDQWEQRIALPAAELRAPARVQASSKAGEPAPWDRLATDFAGGGARLEATLDAAEQMRHSILSERGPAATTRAHSNRPSQGAPRPRTPSIGVELAAFRQRSRPKLGNGLFALGLLVMLGAAGFYYAVVRRDVEKLVTPTSFDTPSVPALATSVGIPTRKRLSVAEERTECIRSYFRPDTIAAGVDLGFVCTEEDFLVVDRKLNDEAMVSPPSAIGSLEPSGVQAAASSSSAPRAESNTTMVIRSGANAKGWQLGWYEIVATAIIRQNCCREAAPIRLPESSGWCQQLQAVVRRIAVDSVKVGDISPGVRVFDEAITCLMAQGRHTVYPYKAVPTAQHKSAFQQFLRHAAEVDARRTARR